MAIGDQVVRRHPQLKSSTALTTKASPDTDGGELLQRELAHNVEEELEGGEQGHEEDHNGDEEGNCNQH